MSEDFSIQTLHEIPAQSVFADVGSREQRRDRQPGVRAGAVDSVSLSPEAQKSLQKLQQRDREVRAHEQAHIAAGGQHAGGASFAYQSGPDGRQYAVGGSVPIDTSPVPNDPQATEEKARTVRRAALAPTDPSAADQNIAAKASAMEAKARNEKTEQDDIAGVAEQTAVADEAGDFGSAKGEAAEKSLRGGAVSAYERTASPNFGASRQSGGGTKRRDPISSLNTLPWPGPERAAAVYAAADAAARPLTALALWGTGISMTV